MSTFRIKDLMIKVLPKGDAPAQGGRLICVLTCDDPGSPTCAFSDCGCTEGCSQGPNTNECPGCSNECTDCSKGCSSPHGCTAPCSEESSCVGCSDDGACSGGCTAPCSGGCSQPCSQACTGGCSKGCSGQCTHVSNPCGRQPCTADSGPFNARADVAGLGLDALAQLRRTLSARLAEVDARTKAIETEMRPKTLAEVETLESKFKESLEELGRIRQDLTVSAKTEAPKRDRPDTMEKK